MKLPKGKRGGAGGGGGAGRGEGGSLKCAVIMGYWKIHLNFGGCSMTLSDAHASS